MASIDRPPGTPDREWMNLRALYAYRFERAGLEKRRRVWRILCADYFNALIDPGSTVLELACGYGEFINNVVAARKLAVDLNPDSPGHLNPDVTFFQVSATDLSDIATASVDVVFTSNFLEHLPSKDACSQLFLAVKRILRPAGRFLLLGPNIRYAYKEYWDFYDHHLPLSHLSLEEGLRQQGFDVVKNIPRFLPYTMNSGMPTPSIFIQAYLRLPIVWPLFGKQFFLIAEKARRGG
jgi:SAM-dependent methyltransferase